MELYGITLSFFLVVFGVVTIASLIQAFRLHNIIKEIKKEYEK